MSFDRKRLRGTLRAKMGVKNNADVFESSGNSWHTTPAQERREQADKQLLRETLRTIHSHVPKQPPKRPRDAEQPYWRTDTPISDRKLTPTERLQAIQSIKRQLADPGPIEPVKYDKQALAAQKRAVRPVHSCRNAKSNAVVAAIAKATRLAQLDKEMRERPSDHLHNTVKARALPHYTLVRSPLRDGEYEEIMEAGIKRTIQALTYLFLIRSPNLSHVGQH